MPSTRGTKRPGKRRPARRKPATKAPKGLRCPDCDFVAKHAMGLGRHRSTRHGVTSQRQQRRQESGRWLTRREAARRAGVHYNTIRHWEKTGRLRREKGSGGRGALVSASDLEGLRRGTAAPAADGIDPARIEALERRFNDLLDGLESLVAGARIRPRRGRPPGSRNTKRGR
ncbi:MAG: MerR family transcriptional regulator [Actinomycetota bacterium]